MNIKGTLSEKNVKAAFVGESQARNKYTYYALQAKKEGYNDVAEFFEKMAGNETEHAKIWFKIINDGLGTTETNLMDSAKGENYEWKSMYPEFAKQARTDGFEMLALMFERVASIENDHERKFIEALLTFQSEKDGTDISGMQIEQSNMNYRCMFCGHLEENRPDVCSVCEAIGSFEVIK